MHTSACSSFATSLQQLKTSKWTADQESARPCGDVLLALIRLRTLPIEYICKDISAKVVVDAFEGGRVDPERPGSRQCANGLEAIWT